MITIASAIFAIPILIAAVIFCFLLKKPHAAARLATAGMFSCFLMALALAPQILDLQHKHTLPVEASVIWIGLQGLTIEFGILLDGLSYLMLLVVTGIGTLIFLYSMTYMHGDESYARFFASLSLFAFSMLGIVFSNNLIQTFIFWELVGLSSYLLIGFWYQKPEASLAGKKAFLTTRVGDVGMMFGILLLWGHLAAQDSGTFNFMALKAHAGLAAIPALSMTLIGLGLFMGAVGKSAQVPLHVWLPDAMEGPTPVSALIHAATMVAAGVFLLARIFFLLELSPTALSIIAWTGTLTSLLAALIAVVQSDIKKILAYSTLSQLGYMVMAIGRGHVEAGMFHLTTHAFFKALLFLGAGSFIHAMHTQSIWDMGAYGQKKFLALFKKMPVTSLTFIAGTLALMGIPPTSGFFSKEEILAAAHGGPQLMFICAAVVVFLTAFYMGRLSGAVFLPGTIHLSHTAGHHEPHAPHEPDWRMLLPLAVLGVLALIGGFLPIRELLPEAHGHHEGGSFLLILSLSLAGAGFLLGILLFRNHDESRVSTGLAAVPRTLLERKFFFDDAYDWLIQNVQERTASFCDLFEKIVVVELGANGIARLARGAGSTARKLQTGIVQFYALVFTAGLGLLIYFFVSGRLG